MCFERFGHPGVIIMVVTTISVRTLRGWYLRRVVLLEGENKPGAGGGGGGPEPA